MKTTISVSTGFSGKFLLKRILLLCGILASILYAAMIFAIQYEGYNIASQTVSELSATGSPTRPLWLPLGIAYQALMIMYGSGLWLSAAQNRALRIIACMILLDYGIASFLWPIASMHSREVLVSGGKTFADTLHIILVTVTVLCNLSAIGFGAFAFGKQFRFYSIVTIIIMLFFGVLTGLAAPRVQSNLPTPWVGIWERINILSCLLWIIVLTIILLRSEMKNNSN